MGIFVGKLTILQWKENITMSICYECQMDKIINGCGVSVKDTEVVKGIGVVECKYFMELNGDLLKAQKVKNELINNRNK